MENALLIMIVKQWNVHEVVENQHRLSNKYSTQSYF